MTPHDVQKWLEYGMLEKHYIDHVEPGELEGMSVQTGAVGNTISRETIQFLCRHVTEKMTIVRIDEETVGDMGIPFSSRLVAEDFEEQIRDDGGSLRLSADFDGWYCYESE